MKIMVSMLALLPLAVTALMAGPLAVLSHAEDVTEIGGQKIVTITRKAVSTTKPEFTGVTLAPGRGMEILQITANFPGKGECKRAGFARSGHCQEHAGRARRRVR